MKILAQLLTVAIKVYQFILSPVFGQQCRFYPTCSHYAVDVIEKHGALVGLYYTFKRLLRCHPWHAGGHDPIP